MSTRAKCILCHLVYPHQQSFSRAELVWIYANRIDLKLCNSCVVWVNRRLEKMPLGRLTH